MFLQNTKRGEKNGNSGRKERMMAGFHPMNPEGLFGYKKRSLSEERFGFQALRFGKTSGPD